MTFDDNVIKINDGLATGYAHSGPAAKLVLTYYELIGMMKLLKLKPNESLIKYYNDNKYLLKKNKSQIYRLILIPLNNNKLFVKIKSFYRYLDDISLDLIFFKKNKVNNLFKLLKWCKKASYLIKNIINNWYPIILN